ncbi:MAG: GNAT family N-acetyltransferase [Bacteroidota bacterium]|nr:GNAT family N-acetyltransferase [Bacteroidota bacterium]
MKFNDEVFNEFPVLETGRLLLREITQNDVNEVYKICSSKKAMKYFGKLPFKTILEAEERISATIDAYKNKEGIRWAITLKGSDELIGSAGIWRLVKEHFRGEIGYEIYPDYWKRGIMYEALTEIIKFAFIKINLHTIEANIDPKNIASEKLLLKLRFEKEGYLKESFYFNNKFDDTAIYSLRRTKKYF